MRLTPRLIVNLLAILALTVVTVGWAVLRLVGSSVANRPFVVTADFAESGGVFTNQEVTYRGVLVGQVGDLRLSQDGVDIELVIDAEWAGKIPEAVEAEIQSKSAVGEQFVNLTPLYTTGQTLSDGDTIPRTRTNLPVDFQRLLRTLDRVLEDVPPEETRELIESLAEGLGGRGDEIALILESIGTLSEAFASVAPEQEKLLEDATRTGKVFLDTKDEFARAMRAADRVLTAVGDEPAELRALFAANDRFSRAGIRFLIANGDELERGFGALAEFIEFQLDERDALVRSLTYVPQFLGAIEDAAVPWRSPDGREFYRIRAGLVLDNVRETWPCKYKVPQGYERLPHVRAPKPVATAGECLPTPTETSRLTASLLDAFAAALRAPGVGGRGAPPSPTRP